MGISWLPLLFSLVRDLPLAYGRCERCVILVTLVKKYNSLGDLVQVLGTPGKKGTGLNPLQFDNPAELYVDDTGEMYIVDGDGGLNNRLVKLSQGTCLTWVCHDQKDIIL